MTARNIVRIVQVPSGRAEGWRAAIARACESAGWVYVEYWGGQPPALDSDTDYLIMSWSFEGEIPTTKWALLTCNPSEAVRTLVAQHALAEHEALYHASARFSAMSMLAAQGVPVLNDSAFEIVLPGLGPVTLGETLEVILSDSASPISIFGVLPPAVGSRVHWPATLFHYTGAPGVNAPGEIILAGRRRLLFNGPNLSLCAGVWSIRAMIEVDPAPRVELLIEWGHNDQTTKLEHVFTEPGRFELILKREWTTPEPADFRISLLLPALDGYLKVYSVSVEREA